MPAPGHAATGRRTPRRRSGKRTDDHETVLAADGKRVAVPGPNEYSQVNIGVRASKTFHPVTCIHGATVQL
jgi:hypothetical protein